MPKQVHDLAKKLQGEGKSEDSAWAIAQSALKEMNEPPARKPFSESNVKPFPPFDIVQPGDELDKIEKEAVAIGGGLSAQSVGGKKHREGGPGSGQKKGPALPQSGVTPMGPKRTSSSHTRVNEIETICECDNFDNVHKALMRETKFQMASDDTEWITVKGSHIPIKKGENKDEVVKKFLGKQGGKAGGEKSKLTNKEYADAWNWQPSLKSMNDLIGKSGLSDSGVNATFEWNKLTTDEKNKVKPFLAKSHDPKVIDKMKSEQAKRDSPASKSGRDPNRGPEHIEMGTHEGRKLMILKYLEKNPKKKFKPFDSVPYDVMEKHKVDGNDFELAVTDLLSSGKLKRAGSLAYKLKETKTLSDPIFDNVLNALRKETK